MLWDNYGKSVSQQVMMKEMALATKRTTQLTDCNQILAMLIATIGEDPSD